MKYPALKRGRNCRESSKAERIVMRPLSTNLTRMPHSGIRVIRGMADELVETYHLEIGEPGYQTPAHNKRMQSDTLESPADAKLSDRHTNGKK